MPLVNMSILCCIMCIISPLSSVWRHIIHWHYVLSRILNVNIGIHPLGSWQCLILDHVLVECIKGYNLVLNTKTYNSLPLLPPQRFTCPPQITLHANHINSTIKARIIRLYYSLVLPSTLTFAIHYALCYFSRYHSTSVPWIFPSLSCHRFSSLCKLWLFFILQDRKKWAGWEQKGR